MNVLNKKNINWIIVIIYVLQMFILSDEFFFIFSCGIFIWLLLQSKGKIKIPNIPGWNIYIIFLLIITIVGIIKYPIRFVARDLFYEFNNIILVFIGYILYKKENNFRKILSTVFFAVGLVSAITLTTSAFLMIGGGVSFGTFRQNFSTGIKPLEWFFPIFSIWILIFKNSIFGRKIDRLILAICMIQIVANLSRTTVLSILVNYLITIFLLNSTKKANGKQIKRAFSTSVIIVFGFVIILSIIPDTIVTQFIDKVMRSFVEINFNGVFNSLADANKNWRGYEISQAISQWKQASLINQIFGSGNGTLISINYVPDQWNDIIQNLNGISGVTVLHNSYYTLLIKGGIITVIAFLLIFIRGIRKGIRYLRKSICDEDVMTALSLVILCCTMLIDAYVTRGMVQNDAQFLWAVLFGWLNAKIRKGRSMESTYGCKRPREI